MSVASAEACSPQKATSESPVIDPQSLAGLPTGRLLRTNLDTICLDVFGVTIPNFGLWRSVKVRFLFDVMPSIGGERVDRMRANMRPIPESTPSQYPLRARRNP
jgi:hypothetical protein